MADAIKKETTSISAEEKIRTGIEPEQQKENIPEQKPVSEVEKAMIEKKEKEDLKEVEGAVKTEKPKRKRPPKKTSSLMKDEKLLEDLRNIMEMDKPQQVKELVYLSFKKGIHYATDLAKKLKDPYLIDEFHDTLVDELYDLLTKKKKLKRK